MIEAKSERTSIPFMDLSIPLPNPTPGLLVEVLAKAERALGQIETNSNSGGLVPYLIKHAMLCHLVLVTLPLPESASQASAPPTVKTIELDVFKMNWTKDQQQNFLSKLLHLAMHLEICMRTIDKGREFLDKSRLAWLAFMALWDAGQRILATTGGVGAFSKVYSGDKGRLPSVRLDMSCFGQLTLRQACERMQLFEPQTLMARDKLLSYFESQKGDLIYGISTETEYTMNHPWMQFIQRLANEAKQPWDASTKTPVDIACQFLITGMNNVSELQQTHTMVIHFKMSLLPSNHRSIPHAKTFSEHDWHCWIDIGRKQDGPPPKRNLNVATYGTWMSLDCPKDENWKTLPHEIAAYLSTDNKETKFTEDDVLYTEKLPLFGDALSSEDSESLMSCLVEPYTRVPLILAYFTEKDRSSSLLSKQLCKLLMCSLFATGYYASVENLAQDTKSLQASSLSLPIPTEALGTRFGALANELVFSPDATLRPAIKLLRHLITELEHQSYTTPCVGLIFWGIKLAFRLQSFALWALSSSSLWPASLAENSRSLAECQRTLEDLMTREFLVVLRLWLEQAKQASDRRGLILVLFFQNFYFTSSSFSFFM